MDRMRNLMRLVALALVALFGLLFFTMFQTLQGLETKQKGGSGGAASSPSLSMPATLQEAEVLERLLGRGYQVVFREDLTNDGLDEVLAYSPHQPGRPGGGHPIVARRALVATLSDTGWRTLFDTSSPLSWSMPAADTARLAVVLGLVQMDQVAPALAQLETYRIDATLRRRLVVEPLTRHLRLPAVHFSWDNHRVRYLPGLQAPAATPGAGSTGS